MSKIKGERPTFRNTDMATLVRQADPKPSFYPTYIFSAKTFVKRDVPGAQPRPRPAPTPKPNPFGFGSVAGAAREVHCISAPVTPTGYNAPATWSVSGHQYGVAGDPHWDNVWSLVHFDEYTDEGAGVLRCEKGKSPTTYGDADLALSSGLFGSGLSIESTAGSRLAYAEQILGADTNICTIEMAFSVSEVEPFHFGFLYLQGGGRIQINITNGAIAAGFSGPQISSSELIQPDVVYRVALVNDGSTVYLFIDGVLQGTAANPGSEPPAPATEEINVGSINDTGYPGFIHIDELRITLGVARYTEDYELAANPFPGPPVPPGPIAAEARVNGGAWATSGTIRPGDSIQTRLTTSSVGGVLHRATLSVEGVNATFDVLTDN